MDSGSFCRTLKFVHLRMVNFPSCESSLPCAHLIMSHGSCCGAAVSGCQSLMDGGPGGLFARGLKARTTTGLVVMPPYCAYMNFLFAGTGPSARAGAVLVRVRSGHLITKQWHCDLDKLAWRSAG